MSGPYNQPSIDRAFDETLRDLRRSIRRLEGGAASRGAVQTNRLVIGRYVVEVGAIDGTETLIAYASDDPTRPVDLLAALHTSLPAP